MVSTFTPVCQTRAKYCLKIIVGQHKLTPDVLPGKESEIHKSQIALFFLALWFQSLISSIHGLYTYLALR